ncbi:MAG: DUF4942 domain-containing protein [Nevskiaceae bacterium]|nr:MAG: DUF4942 domain-containing protein [Nevskiaceae bacterium]
MFDEAQQLGGESFATGDLGGGTRDWQYYPTSEALADKAWSLFKNRHVERLIDLCAGTGALADAYMRRMRSIYGSHYHSHSSNVVDHLVDVVEIDARHHPALRDKGYKIVGLDFNCFDMAAGVGYTHAICNPPFNLGARFAIKAYEMLWEGEVVVILNAETVRNPCNSERRMLVQLIEQHGSVEFVKDAFIGSGVERETEVEVALVYLRKTGDCNTDHIAPLIESLSKDTDGAGGEDIKLPYELALPANFVENQCRAFRMAVKAMREAVRAEAVASYFAARVGRTMAKLNDKEGAVKDAPIDDSSIRSTLRTRYMELKDRAWASILRNTETMERLSQKVQKQAESHFAHVKTLEFTESNVYGFLLGLVQSQPEMQANMCEEVFDLFSRYHSSNLVFYSAWRYKSADKHRANGMRLRTTRFILPNNGCYSQCLNHEAEQRLGDIDKVFALMDGKQLPDYGLRDVFREHFGRLKATLNKPLISTLRRTDALLA